MTVQQGRQRLGQLDLAVPVRGQGLAEPLHELARFRGAGAFDPSDGLVDALQVREHQQRKVLFGLVPAQRRDPHRYLDDLL
jgi:hypothetical protein